MGRRFRAALRAKGPRWIRVVGERHDEVERQPRHRLDPAEVDEMRVVARPVVLVVQSRVEHHRGDSGGDEGIVIGVVGDLPVVHELEPRVAVGLERGHPQAVGRPRAVDLHPLAAQAADHVEVHREDDLEGGQPRGPRPQEVVRTEQALFLAIPEGEEDRPPRPAWHVLEGLGDLDQPGHSRGIVVGAVVDVAGGAVAVARVAVADVVVVGAHHHQLARHRRIAAGHEREDVAHAAEGLVIGAVVTGRLEAELFDRLHDVGAGGSAAPAPSLAAFEGIVGQGMHMPAGVGGLNARVGRRHPLGGSRLPGGQRRQGEQADRGERCGGCGK